MDDFLFSLCQYGRVCWQDYDEGAYSQNLRIRLTSLQGSDLFLYELSVLTLSVGAITGLKLYRVVSLSSSNREGPQVHSNPQYSYTTSQISLQEPYKQEFHNNYPVPHPKSFVQPQNHSNANTLKLVTIFTTLIKQQILWLDITMYNP